MSKINIVKQHDLKDCGICCLSSIIKHYNGFVPIEKLRLDTHPSESGTTALSLLETGRKYGFDSMGVKITSLDEEINLPAIAHITTKYGLDHFVVIYKISKNVVTIMDPAQGKVVMKKQEFTKLWNNVLLLFYPKEKIAIIQKESSLISLFGNLFIREKKLFISIGISSLLLTTFTILSSYYIKITMEAISKNVAVTYLRAIVIIFSIFLLFKLLFTIIRKRLENHLNKNIDVLLLKEFIEHIFHLPLEVTKSRSSGEILARVRELMNIKNMFTELIISCGLDLLLMIASVPILYRINNNLFFILLFIVIIYFLIGAITSKILYKMAYRNIELESVFNTTLLEHINLIQSSKNLFATDNTLKKIEKSLAPFLMDNFRFVNFLNNEINLKTWVYEVGLFTINTIGFILIYQEKLTFTELITFNTLVVYFLEPIKNIIETLPKYLFTKASFSKINEFLSIEKEDYGKIEELPDGSIEVDNLTYSYNNYNKLLQNVNFKIKSGDFVLIKGSSGCGKSTLCQIFEKNISLYSGKILIGGINLKDYSVGTIRQNITFVSQNEALITASIKENILMGRKIPNAIFNHVCSICEIENIVEKKPFRYETIITNESSFISGGERQRIILARALLKEAKIYLIDEALSEVDYETEQRILKKIKKELKGKTILYITHKNHDSLFKNKIELEGWHGL